MPHTVYLSINRFGSLCPLTALSLRDYRRVSFSFCCTHTNVLISPFCSSAVGFLQLSRPRSQAIAQGGCRLGIAFLLIPLVPVNLAVSNSPRWRSTGRLHVLPSQKHTDTGLSKRKKENGNKRNRKLDESVVTSSPLPASIQAHLIPSSMAPLETNGPSALAPRVSSPGVFACRFSSSLLVFIVMIIIVVVGCRG